MTAQRPILLVGSVPLPSAQSVFDTVGPDLGPLAARLPDGETGERIQWVMFQEDRFRSNPGFEVASQWDLNGLILTQFKLKSGWKAEDIKLGPLGYAHSAKASYEAFTRARVAGRIPPSTRLQVSLPTVYAVVNAFITREQVEMIWPLYERQMDEEVREICAAIPAHDLAIQWDIAPEVSTLMGIRKERLERFPRPRILAALARLSNSVPAGVELGWHFCFGDPNHKHSGEAADLGILVDLANDLFPMTSRSVEWIHMPVPRARSDDAYFAPLQRLKAPPGCALYLGLVHYTDGLEGARRRVAAAAKFHPRFGVATECGFGRRPPETIPALLKLHREVAAL